MSRTRDKQSKSSEPHDPAKVYGHQSIPRRNSESLWEQRQQKLQAAPTFRVFLSYSRPNARAVSAIYKKLLDEGIAAWMDEKDIQVGEQWELAIDRALRQAQLVLVFLSQNAVARDGYLQKEIRDSVALAEKKAPGGVFVIPVMLDDCPPHELLHRHHHIRLTEKGAWGRLVDQIHERRRKYSHMCSQRESTLGKPIQRKSRGEPGAENGSGSPPGAQPPHTGRIPLADFSAELGRFIHDSISARAWSRCSRQTQELVLTLGSKLEPIVQISPVTASPLVVGFECLALGPRGEGFSEICAQAWPLDPGLLRICMAIAAVKTVAALRAEAAKMGKVGAKNLQFSINLDPYMLASERLKPFLEWYHHDIRHNVIFEVNESTTRACVEQLLNLRVDYELRYAADDLNRWNKSVRSALIDRVDMTKMDCKAFLQAMRVRGQDPSKTLVRLRAHKIPNKPLVVEGVQHPDYAHFLELAWDSNQWGELYGQGYSLECGVPWEGAVQSLKAYGLPGGGFFRKE